MIKITINKPINQDVLKEELSPYEYSITNEERDLFVYNDDAIESDLQAIVDNHDASASTREQDLETSQTNIRNRKEDLKSHAMFIDYLNQWLHDADRNLEDANTRFAALAALLEDTTKTSAGDKAMFNAALEAETGLVITWKNVVSVLLVTRRKVNGWARGFITSKTAHITA